MSQQEALIALVTAMPVPALFVGRDERIAAANPAAQRLFGLTLQARHYISVLRQPDLLDCVGSALSDGNVASGKFLSSDTGRETGYQVRAAPVAGGGLDGVLVCFEDISQMRDAVQMRRDFVANVSHELRSPLTALLGFIETLRGPARDDAAARERFLGTMEREAERMNRLVGDLLSLGRVEAEERMRPAQQVEICALLGSVQLALAPLAKTAGATLVLAGCDSPMSLPGDADQLTQVFTNLVENAIKYGGGEVSISISRHDRDSALQAGAVHITVADQGAGIDQRHLPRLTERFYRVDSHRSRELGGTGLGLAIVKHIVNRHRGRLRVESQKGAGSRFTVILPDTYTP